MFLQSLTGEEMSRAFVDVGRGLSGRFEELAQAMQSGDIERAQQLSGEVIEELQQGLRGRGAGATRSLMQRIGRGSEAGRQLVEGVNIAESVTRRARRQGRRRGGRVTISELDEMLGGAVSGEDLEQFIAAEGIEVTGQGRERGISANDVEEIADEIAGKITGLGIAGQGAAAAAGGRATYEQEMAKTLSGMTSAMDSMTRFVEAVNEHVGEGELKEAGARADAKKAAAQAGGAEEEGWW
jgi:hypothetical protein